MFIEKHVTYPQKLFEWKNDEKINGNISDDQWKQISQPFIETDDSKLQTLQFRINHIILYTHTFLMKIKIKESEQCTFCHSARETSIHALRP